MCRSVIEVETVLRRELERPQVIRICKTAACMVALSLSGVKQKGFRCLVQACSVFHVLLYLEKPTG